MAQQIARNIITFSLSLILILSAGPLQAMAFSDQYASFQKSNQETYRQPSTSQSRNPGQVRSYTQQIKRRNDQSALSQRPSLDSDFSPSRSAKERTQRQRIKQAKNIPQVQTEKLFKHRGSYSNKAKKTQQALNIPVNPGRGISLKNNVSIDMPGKQMMKRGKQSSQGTVTYKGKKHFDNVVKNLEGDALQLHVVIKSSEAPTEYEYTFNDDVTLTKATNGEEEGVAILNEETSDLEGIVRAPWAKDNSGQQIDTFFEIEDNTLIQHVAHRQKGTVYPVVADPHVEWHWWGTTLYLNKTETELAGTSLGFAATIVGGYYGFIAGLTVEFLGSFAQFATIFDKCVGVNTPYHPVHPSWIFIHNDKYCY